MPASSRIYLTQRAVLRSIQRTPDVFQLEERLLTLVGMIMEAALGADRCRVPSTEEHRNLVNDAKQHMARNFGSVLSLAAIGWEVGASSFHLARVFRSVTGQTVHRYLTDLRLRAALNLLEETSRGIAEIAVDVGFASHSHLTNSFGKRFGVTPSAYRVGGQFSDAKTTLT